MSRDIRSVKDIGDSLIKGNDPDLLRENANLNGETFSGRKSKMGSEVSKEYARHNGIPFDVMKAVDNNYLYIHDFDEYVYGTTNCIFIPFGTLLRDGFSTGNGSVRPPKSIQSAMSLVAIIFQSQQNAQYGGVSANMLDHDLAPYVAISFEKHFAKALAFQGIDGIKQPDKVKIGSSWLRENFQKAYDFAYKETVAETRQAAESLIHNLNTMSSRAGGQIPFTSINYGTCTSPEGRLVISSLLEATVSGLGNGETPIFPIQIFKCKKGVNQSADDPNYDLFVKALDCSSKRLYPNFANIDAPLNLQYYKEGEPDTEFATMGCRTRVVGDRFGRNHLSGKGNLSFNTLNLVKMGIEHGLCLGERTKPDMDSFYADVDKYLNLALEGLIHRYDIQKRQPAKASDFMMREGVWEGGKGLAPEEAVGEVIKHGSLSIGFIGLAECMKALFGKHHAEDPEVYWEAEQLITHLRDFCDRKSDELNLNISLFATPAEGLSGKFTKVDKGMYGEIKGVTDREYYTNSFHVPVYFHIPSYKKIQLEAPFHDMCNAGAISYIEIDGNARTNQKAFADIVKFALDLNISYFSVNHTIDRCPACGYEGIIGDECPNCGTHESEVHFYRLRRVTGYLTGDFQTRFNGAKVAEVNDRVKHL